MIFRSLLWLIMYIHMIHSEPRRVHSIVLHNWHHAMQHTKIQIGHIKFIVKSAFKLYMVFLYSLTAGPGSQCKQLYNSHFRLCTDLQQNIVLLRWSHHSTEGHAHTSSRRGGTFTFKKAFCTFNFQFLWFPHTFKLRHHSSILLSSYLKPHIFSHPKEYRCPYPKMSFW